MSKQTAVDWLFLMINNPNDNQEMALKCLAKAKAMEREQIQDAFYHGVDIDAFNINNKWTEAEKYYKQNFIGQDE